MYQVILNNRKAYQHDLPLPGTSNGRTTQEWRAFPLAVCCLLHATGWETLKNILTNTCVHSLRADNSECHFTCRATYTHAKISITRRSLSVVAEIFAAEFYIKLKSILFPARILRKSYSFKRIYLHERKLSKFFMLCIQFPTLQLCLNTYIRGLCMNNIANCVLRNSNFTLIQNNWNWWYFTEFWRCLFDYLCLNYLCFALILVSSL